MNKVKLIKKYKKEIMECKKKDNNLVCITIGKKKLYYSTYRKAGLLLGVQAASIQWAIKHKNKLITMDDKVATIELIDGSEIPYKYINA